jgi:succinate dehydrogenase / fumarate reductase iron-sulfur subunit
MRITLKVWRQKARNADGKFETYQLDHVDEEMSFLEMFDVLNEQLISKGEEPVAFDHDCREGICGACSMYINGRAHGPMKATTACQLHMRFFKDGDTITVEPWRAKAFPVIKDLVVDRAAFDRIQAAGGYVSVNTGNAVDANDILIPKVIADEAFAAASCIACGACVVAARKTGTRTTCAEYGGST